MLLEIRLQKNDTVVLKAPDGSVYAFPLIGGKEAGADVLQRMGRTMLEILDDPDQPKTVVTSTGVSQGGEGNLEQNIRGALDSIVPGGGRIIDFLQGISGDELPEKKEDAG